MYSPLQRLFVLKYCTYSVFSGAYELPKAFSGSYAPDALESKNQLSDGMYVSSDTFCAKLVRATSVRVLPKCRPMIKI